MATTPSGWIATGDIQRREHALDELEQPLLEARALLGQPERFVTSARNDLMNHPGWSARNWVQIQDLHGRARVADWP